jgi:hypothetical protein
VTRDRARYGRLIAATAVATSMVVSSTAAWAQSHDDGPHYGPAGQNAGPPLHRAPKDFRQQLIDAYHPVPAMQSAHPRPLSSPTTSAAAFEKEVRALDQRGLDLIYTAGPQVWTQIRDALATLPIPSATFHGSSVAAEQPPDPEHSSCKSGEELVGEQTRAAVVENAAAVIDTVLDHIEEEITVTIIAFPLTIANPVYALLFTFKTALEQTAANYSFDVDLQGWCKAANEFSSDTYVAIDGPHSLFDFDKLLLAGYGPILAHIAAAKKQLQDRSTTTEQHLADSGNQIKQIEDQSAASLHTQIESALNGDGFSELLLKPASEGGYLDATNNGVKQIVTDALAAMRATNQPVSSAGPRYLALANDKLAAGEYKKAFHFYQLAYQEIAKY